MWILAFLSSNSTVHYYLNQGRPYLNKRMSGQPNKYMFLTQFFELIRTQWAIPLTYIYMSDCQYRVGYFFQYSM